MTMEYKEVSQRLRLNRPEFARSADAVDKIVEALEAGGELPHHIVEPAPHIVEPAPSETPQEQDELSATILARSVESGKRSVLMNWWRPHENKFGIPEFVAKTECSQLEEGEVFLTNLGLPGFFINNLTDFYRKLTDALGAEEIAGFDFGKSYFQRRSNGEVLEIKSAVSVFVTPISPLILIRFPYLQWNPQTKGD